jgi:ribosomal small subunit protein bTHX
MGKGDKKTKRGKIILGSYGVRRKRKASTAVFKKIVKPAKVIRTAEVAEEVKPAKEKKIKVPPKETSIKKKKEAEKTED